MREYYLVVHQQKLDMLDRLNLDRLVDDYFEAEQLMLKGEADSDKVKQLKGRVDAVADSILSTSQDFSMLGKPNEMDHMILEQFYNGRIFTWSLLLAFLLLIHVAVYAFFNLLVDLALKWDPITGERSADKVRRKSR